MKGSKIRTGLRRIVDNASKRVVNIALASGLGLGALVQSGCEMTPQDEALLGAVISGANAQLAQQEGDIRKAIGYQSISNLMGKSAQWQHEEEVARQGRQNINIYANSSQERGETRYAETKFEQNSQQKIFNVNGFGKVVIGTCNYFGDFDNNGIIAYPEEYLSDNRPGMKERFKEGEKINLVISAGRMIPNLRLSVFDREGTEVDSFSSFGELWGTNREYNSSSGDKNLGEGSYRAMWYSGNKFLGAWSFDVGK